MVRPQMPQFSCRAAMVRRSRSLVVVVPRLVPTVSLR